MKETKIYKILLWKAYFDKGFGLLNYVKYILAVAGVSAAFNGIEIKTIVIIGVIYGIVCLILGRLWFHYKLVDMEAEIQNKINPFQREIREHLKKRTFK